MRAVFSRLTRREKAQVLIVRAEGAYLYPPAQDPSSKDPSTGSGDRSERSMAKGRVLHFDATEEGFAALRSHLLLGEARGRAEYPIRLLVDLVEEDFRLENVPHVIGRSRRSVQDLRGRRLFPGASHIHVLRRGRADPPDGEAGRNRSGRRDDIVLFSAIVRPEYLDPWLDLLRECDIPLVGVTSLPLASETLLRLPGFIDLLRSGERESSSSSSPSDGEKPSSSVPSKSSDALAQRMLLVSESGRFALRQSFFKKGRLVMSRLAVLPEGDAWLRGRRAMEEIERFCRHLERSERSEQADSGAKDVDIDIEVVALVGGALAGALRSQIGSQSGSQSIKRDPDAFEGLSILDAKEIAPFLSKVRVDPSWSSPSPPALGKRAPFGQREDGDSTSTSAAPAAAPPAMKSDIDAGEADMLIAHLAGRGFFPNHYASPTMLGLWRAMRLARALKAAGVAALVAGMVWGGLAWQRAGEIDSEIADIDHRIHGLGMRMQAPMRSPPSIPLPDLRRAVAAAQAIEGGGARLEPLFAALSDSLEGFPDIHPSSIEWFDPFIRADRDPFADRRASEDGSLQAEGVDALDRTTLVELIGERRRIVNLQASLRPIGGHVRPAADEIRRFSRAMAQEDRFGDIEAIGVPSRTWEDYGPSSSPRSVDFTMRMVFDAPPK
ncbi:hypothetical protein [Thioalkalivibrio sp. HK1]|uniref:hypothetical protein n=1 Tax=Thioalkalivibrio sp. HK1 TaxID=1469245 RepID=UPI0004B7292B|nr:hypothetical protein [Thioalkalivibrio sp. HK1]